LAGPLHLAALQASLSDIEARHDILRTHIEERGGQAVQVVLPPGSAASLPVIDLEGLAPAQQEHQRRHLIWQQAHEPFAFHHGPLWRQSMLRLTPQRSMLLVTMHHLITDGWSVPILLEELRAGYLAHLAFSSGATAAVPGLPVLPIQYADYAQWQRAWVQGAYLETELAYWRDQLQGVEPLSLPTDHPRPAVQSFRGARLRQRLSPSLSQALRHLSRQEGVTLFMSLLAGWLIVLARYSQQRDLVVGTPIANRWHVEVEPLIGFFVNTLVLRCSVQEEQSVRELLKAVRTVSLEAYSHQEVPFEQVVEALAPQRDLSHMPLFQVMVASQPTIPDHLQWGELTVRLEETVLDAVKFDLAVLVQEGAQQIEVVFEYATDLFEASTISRMFRHWQQVLETLVQHPERKVGTISLLTPDEYRVQVEQWNTPTPRLPSHGACLHQLFEQQVQRTPDAVALVQQERLLSYQQLNEHANQLAHTLRRLGVGPEVVVGLCLRRSLDLVISILAILKAGGAYLPLDPEYPATRLAFMLNDCQPALLLSHQEFSSTLPPFAGVQLSVEQLWGELACQPTSRANLVGAAHPEQLAYIIYTSGSTGQPKGSLIPHQSIIGFIEGNPSMRLDHAQVHLQHSALSWDAFTLEVWPALLSGGCCVLSAYDHASFDELGQLIKTYGVQPLWVR